MRRIVWIFMVALGAALSAIAVSRAKPPAAARVQTATFAAGCFFGVEETFRRMDGVLSTTAGFTGGYVADPTYRQVSTTDTGHVEAVRITFDPMRISFAELLDAFWSCHDVTRERDGEEPHRSIVFFHDDQQHMTALASRDEVNASGAFDGRPIQTDFRAATDFFPAEDEHQQYLAKLGRAPTCSVGERPVHTRLAAAARAHREAR
jgi:peptide-methionine (S)-S-oxide reductase